MYDNEGPVGEAVRESDVPREDIFVVTKLYQTNLAYEDVHSSFETSLSKLGLDYVDLLLIHAPNRSVPIEETIEAMNELQADGVVDHIGVSNFSIKQMKDAMSASNTPILTNQVKYHPFHGQQEMLKFCREEDVMLTAYSPLARTRVSRDETLSEIGDRYGKTPAQVALRWQIQQPMVSTIPKAADPDHQRENIDIFDFELSDDEMEAVFGLDG
jgi:diketogulonate reductase-like aldo/keto reductase